MEDEAYKELMEIQSALNDVPIIKSEISYKTEDPQMSGNGPTFKKPMSCSNCGKSFMSISKLKLHERIHIGEKPFGCSRCDKKFAYTNVLKVHERTHTNEKPFSCSKCDKSFTVARDLSIHERIHNGKNHSAAQSVTRNSGD